jgi:hypothetical protein
MPLQSHRIQNKYSYKSRRHLASSHSIALYAALMIPTVLLKGDLTHIRSHVKHPGGPKTHTGRNTHSFKPLVLTPNTRAKQLSRRNEVYYELRLPFGLWLVPLFKCKECLP